MIKNTLYCVYDKTTGEVYHQYLNKMQMKKQKYRAKLFGLKVKVKKQKRILEE